jgi:uncharacterized protein (UPF0147 family)
MEQVNIGALLTKYNAGQANAEEVKMIEKCIEEGVIDLADLHDLNLLNEQVIHVEDPSPSLQLDDRFYHMLAQEKKQAKTFSWKQFFAWPEIIPRLAFASVTLIIGLAAGYFIRQQPAGNANQGEIAVLSQQVTDLKEMMMLSLLEKESATDRLKAVSLTQDMDQVSNKVTLALLETLNNDSNVNVRLAALDALKAYAKESAVREELIRSIAKQESPLVQLELAELMAALQAKSSVKELEKLLQDKNTPKEVKKKIQESIQVII